MSYISFRLCLLIVTINAVTADRIKDMIYLSLDGAAACFRRHNGTHQFGCSSTRDGSVGVIQLVNGDEDLMWLKNNATAGPYTIVMPFSMFTPSVTNQIDALDNVNGMLVTRSKNETIPSNYSPESKCPNEYSGSKSCDLRNPWNSLGYDFILKDWRYPIFYIENDELVQQVKQCYYKHNSHNLDEQSERSLCALEMQSFMSATIDSESCIRRSNTKWQINPARFCDPLGDRNIHWSLKPITADTKSIILIMARLDAISMFSTIVPGANSAVAGFVTLLATVYHLNSLDATVEDTNVLFSLMNGESFDYIGSSRFVYDLKEGMFSSFGGVKVKLDSIKTIIELGQLGGGDKLYLHANNHYGDDLIQKLQKSLSLENTTLPNSVPPASIQSFLTVRPNMSAVVIANHGKQFTNKYYGGILDTVEALGSDWEKLNKTLANIAITLGNLLYEKVTGKTPPSSNKTFIEELVTEMLSCYLVSAQCNLFQITSSPGVKLPNEAFPLYVSVNNDPNKATTYTAHLLMWFTGKKLSELSVKECVEYGLYWMNGNNFTGICINSTVTYTFAVSPAFTIDGYSMKSGLYSTWTESVWHSLSVRMFLKPSARTERLSITLGSVVAILSFFTVWFVNSRAKLIFNNSRINTNC